MISGKAIIFGDNVDTDQIIGAHHLVIPEIKEMARYTFEHYSDFTENFCSGDILVGGKNFGCGSSREQAPAVLMARGVGAVVAASFARIFFRNAFNLGLPVIECAESEMIRSADRLVIEDGGIFNQTGEQHYKAKWFRR